MVADTANHIVEEIVLATCIVLKGNNYHVFLANVKRFFTIIFTAVFLIRKFRGLQVGLNLLTFSIIRGMNGKDVHTKLIKSS